MSWIDRKCLAVLSITGVAILSGCNVDFSAPAANELKTVSCQSTDKASSDFWGCEENNKLRFSVFLEKANLSINLRNGEFYLSRDLGHLDDPDFEDLLIFSDSLPYLVKLVCEKSLDVEKLNSNNEGYASSSKYEADVRVRRSITEDPNVYEWRVKAEDVYSSLKKYC